MRLVSWKRGNSRGVAFRRGSDLVSLEAPDIIAALRAGKQALESAAARAEKILDPAGLEYLPAVPNPAKIVCVGMNYQDHADENKLAAQEHPTFFLRVATSLIGHGQPILRPFLSQQLDYEGELAAVIGTPGRHISVERALDHIAGYSVFNEASIRDYQVHRGQQWTLGKNFDGTGAFGPDLVTADELPSGAKGLRLEMRLNGAVMQSANTGGMIFDVATLVSKLSEAMTLETGDVLVTGTPAGIGFFRKPRVYMKHGDVCEVEIEGIGTLRNPVCDEIAPG